MRLEFWQSLQEGYFGAPLDAVGAERFERCGGGFVWNRIAGSGGACGCGRCGRSMGGAGGTRGDGPRWDGHGAYVFDGVKGEWEMWEL